MYVMNRYIVTRAYAMIQSFVVSIDMIIYKVQSVIE